MFEFKIVLAGSMSVGKTSLVLRYAEGTFKKEVSATVGASFFTKKITVGKQQAKLQLWDTAGAERFRTMAPMYYRGANAALLVYDVTDRKSLDDLQSWVDELRSAADCSDTVFCIIANKMDLATESTVAVEDGRAYADQIEAEFFETSAKNDEGINDMFVEVTRILLEIHGEDQRISDTVVIDGSSSQEKGCC
eukprot:m.18324 g.18324  ORF g.18324 m.18324 type:complete len:193 (+) comp7801_c0_seq1:374-952(+)